MTMNMIMMAATIKLILAADQNLFQAFISCKGHPRVIGRRYIKLSAWHLLPQAHPGPLTDAIHCDALGPSLLSQASLHPRRYLAPMGSLSTRESLASLAPGADQNDDTAGREGGLAAPADE